MKLSKGNRTVAAVLAFSVALLVADRINFSQVLGQQNQYFTLSQFFAPSVASFLGIYLGMFTLGASLLVGFFIAGKAVTATGLLLLSTPLFASYYFANVGKKRFDPMILAVPVVAMAIFISIPAGAGAWYYSLFWLIPIGISIFGLGKNLLARSLGATFTAHAVGSAIWSLAVPMTSAQWTMLLPVTATERLLFASGIAISYVAATSIAKYASKQYDLTPLKLEKQYALGA